MWTPKQLRLTKNSDSEHAWHMLYLKECFTLWIDDKPIHNAIYPNRMTLSDEFETLVCDECGVEGCNGARQLMLRTQGDTLLFLPVFDIMDSFEEFNYETYTGERSCPPHRWYEDGALSMRGEILHQFLRLLPGFDLKKVPPISWEEEAKLKEFEGYVKNLKTVSA